MFLWIRNNPLTALHGTAALIALYLTSLYNYLLFHAVAEIFSIVIAYSIFILGWNSRRYLKDSYLLFLAFAYLFIGALDLLHTLSFKGMGIFPPGTFYANQLWVATRFVESISLLLALYFVHRNRTPSPERIFAYFLGIFALIVASIFWWEIFPVCFVLGEGQTTFKIVSEYIICLILAGNIWILQRMRAHFDPVVHRYLFWSLIFTIGSEFSFTLYVSNYDLANLIGHYLKIFSFFFIYKAIIETGIRTPFNLIFHQLRDSEERLKQSQQLAMIGNFDRDPQTGLSKWSDQTYRIFGYEPQSVQTSYAFFRSHVHEQDAPLADAAFTALKPENPDAEFLFRFYRADKAMRWGKLWAAAHFDAHGQLQRIFGAIQDVTETTESQHVLEWQLRVNRLVSACMESILSRTHSLHDLAKLILDSVLELTESEHGFVASVDSGTHVIRTHTLTQTLGQRCTVGHNDYADTFTPDQDGVHRTLFGQSVNSMQPFFTEQPGTHPASRGVPPGHVPITRFLSAPGIIDGEVRGLVAIANSSKPYTEDILNAVSRLANLFVLALVRHENDMAVARRDAMLQGFLNAINESAFLIDTRGNVLYTNTTMAERLGSTVEELIGAPVLDFLPADVRDLRTQKALEALRTGEPQHFEDIRLGRNIENHIYPVIENGNIISLAILGLDITERKCTEMELLKLRRSVENSPMAIVITDLQGVIEYVNPAFCEVTGYARAEVLGQTPRLLKSGVHDAEFYHTMWSTITSGKSWRSEIANRTKDGQLLWEYLAISPVKDAQGDITNFIAIWEDITARKDLERLKDDVERIMRHDLKTPLNGIVGLPQVLLMEDNLSPEQREIIQAIENSGRKMLDMINLSLDMFKMEIGTYEFTPYPVNLMPIITRLEQDNLVRLKSKNITVLVTINGNAPNPSQPFSLPSDERLLYPLLSNLFTNALEASGPDQTIQITLNGPEPFHISIRNHGAVPVAVREHFFAKYNTFGKKAGTGLGTYSAKLLSSAMGYEIRMETSDADNCTTIHITPRAA